VVEDSSTLATGLYLISIKMILLKYVGLQRTTEFLVKVINVLLTLFGARYSRINVCGSSCSQSRRCSRWSLCLSPVIALAVTNRSFEALVSFQFIDVKAYESHLPHSYV